MWSILEDDNLTLLSRNHKTTQEIIKPKNTNYPTIFHLSCPKHRHFFFALNNFIEPYVEHNPQAETDCRITNHLK